MSLEPDYRLVESTLAELERGSDARLLNGVYSVIDLVLDRSESAAARRGLVHSENGRAIWIVPVPAARHEWSVMWWQDGQIAVFVYIGPWPLR